MAAWRESQFRVVRNTATLNAYRRYSEGVFRAGGPFMLAPAFLSPAFVVGFGVWRRVSAHPSARGAMALVVAWLAFSAVCLAFGVWRMSAYKRAHPFEREPAKGV